MKNITYLTETQKTVAEQTAIAYTAQAFEMIARGEEGWAGLYAKAAYREAVRIKYGVGYQARLAASNTKV